MDDASFVLSITENLLAKISSSVEKETIMLLGMMEVVQRLKDTLTSIRAIEFDAEYKKAQNRYLSDWLFELKDVLYDADDIVDWIEYGVLQRKIAKQENSTVRDFFSNSNPIKFRFKIAHKIRVVREKLDELLDAKSKFQLVERVQDNFVTNRTNVSNSIVRPSNIIIGRDEDKESIIQLLMLDGDRDENISVIPIVGMGGMGKTTLAQLVYNDERVKEYFQMKAWVRVSYAFDIKRLMKDIIKSASDENLGDCTKSDLISRLRYILDDKRFLLVLDDVWNENYGKWVELKEMLSNGSSGSKIVMTTRSMLVASMMGRTHPYLLRRLTADQSMSLLEHALFEEGQEKQHQNLIIMGDEIIRKCRGIPLALISLCGLLRLNTDERFWVSIRDNEAWESKTGLLPILEMSYKLMPSYLKLCFSCLSLFPKDYEFNGTDLIQLWMAQGLITSTDTAEELEEIGEQYIKELLSRSFIQDVQVHDLYTGFKMHDLIHDLTLVFAQHDFWSVNFPTQNIPRIVRHVSFCDTDLSQEEVLKTLLNLNSSLRTIMFPVKGVGPSSNSFDETCVRRFEYLRVLDLSDSSFEMLPSFIVKLKHLRLLSLSNNRHIKQLPKSICRLLNLQTLRLFGCSELDELPRDIGKLKNLRFLYITTKQMSLEIGSLISLRFLSISYCRNLESLDENVMKSLTALRTLWIISCESLKSLPSTLERLTMLKINGCPELARRCQPETGEDWHKIAPIPVITIDSEQIESNLEIRIAAHTS